MARKYLLNFEGVNDDVLKEQLELGEKTKPKTMNELFRGLLWSLSNRRNMGKTIGRIENLKPFLFNFDPFLVAEEYNNDWQSLFQKIQNNYNPPGRMDIREKRSFWVIFCKGTVSGARFLSRFSNIEEFDKLANQFYLNEYTRAALPMLIEKEVFGLGFALACDFLKENGYPEFVKPDVHIKSIFNGIGISNTNDDYEVFKDVIRFSKEIGELPYVVDKLFWLIGSGDFYVRKKPVNTNRDEFIKQVNFQFR